MKSLPAAASSVAKNWASGDVRAADDAFLGQNARADREIGADCVRRTAASTSSGSRARSARVPP